MTGFYPHQKKKYWVELKGNVYVIVRLRDYLTEVGPHIKQVGKSFTNRSDAQRVADYKNYVT